MDEHGSKGLLMVLEVDGVHDFYIASVQIKLGSVSNVRVQMHRSIGFSAVVEVLII